jgi:hypothetical protein
VNHRTPSAYKPDREHKTGTYWAGLFSATAAQVSTRVIRMVTDRFDAGLERLHFLLHDRLRSVRLQMMRGLTIAARTSLNYFAGFAK